MRNKCEIHSQKSGKKDSLRKAYQPWVQKEVEDPNMGTTFQFSHNNDKIAGDENMPGTTTIKTTEDKNQTHSIFSFINQISKLPAGKYKVINGQIVQTN